MRRPVVSYELAVWDGPPPLSNAHAASEWGRLLSARSDAPPAPAIRGFVDALTDAYPDLDHPDGEESPWADGPLLAYAEGTVAAVPVRPERIDEVVELVEKTAAAMSLVAYDPQLAQLLPSATAGPRNTRFELPSADELPLHLVAVMNEALHAGSGMAGIVEQAETGYYVQWLTSGGRLVIEAQGEDRLSPALRLTPAGQAHMAELGFAPAQPNWRQEWADGAANLEHAGRVLGEVLCGVRGLAVGTAMNLQTFPV